MQGSLQGVNINKAKIEQWLGSSQAEESIHLIVNYVLCHKSLMSLIQATVVFIAEWDLFVHQYNCMSSPQNW